MLGLGIILGIIIGLFIAGMLALYLLGKFKMPKP